MLETGQDLQSIERHLHVAGIALFGAEKLANDFTHIVASRFFSSNNYWDKKKIENTGAEDHFKLSPKQLSNLIK